MCVNPTSGIYLNSITTQIPLKASCWTPTQPNSKSSFLTQRKRKGDYPREAIPKPAKLQSTYHSHYTRTINLLPFLHKSSRPTIFTTQEQLTYDSSCTKAANILSRPCTFTAQEQPTHLLCTRAVNILLCCP